MMWNKLRNQGRKKRQTVKVQHIAAVFLKPFNSIFPDSYFFAFIILSHPLCLSLGVAKI